MRAPRYRGAHRGARGVLLGLVLSALAVLGHSLGALAAPEGTSLLLAVLVSCALGMAVAERTARVGAVAAWLVGGQILLHAVFLLSGHSHSVSTGGPPFAAMVAGHALAAIIVALVITRLDGLVGSLVVLLQALTRPVIRLPRISFPDHVASITDPKLLSLPGPGTHLLPCRRGPPACA